MYMCVYVCMCVYIYVYTHIAPCNLAFGFSSELSWQCTFSFGAIYAEILRGELSAGPSCSFVDFIPQNLKLTSRCEQKLPPEKKTRGKPSLQ